MSYPFKQTEEQNYHIQCLHCEKITIVGHLDWTGLICQHCKQTIYRKDIKYNYAEVDMGDGKIRIDRTTTCKRYAIHTYKGSSKDYYLSKRIEFADGSIQYSPSIEPLFPMLSNAKDYVSSLLNFGVIKTNHSFWSKSVTHEEVSEFCASIPGIIKHGKRCQTRINLEMGLVEQLLELSEQLNCSLNASILHIIKTNINDALNDGFDNSTE